MLIDTTEDLCDYFRCEYIQPKHRRQPTVCVSSKIRLEWMLDRKRVTVGGWVYDVIFKDLKGGVWEASIPEVRYYNSDETMIDS